MINKYNLMNNNLKIKVQLNQIQLYYQICKDKKQMMNLKKLFMNMINNFVVILIKLFIIV